MTTKMQVLNNHWIVIMPNYKKRLWLKTTKDTSPKQALNSNNKKVSKVGDHSRGWPEGTFFDSYYTKV